MYMHHVGGPQVLTVGRPSGSAVTDRHSPTPPTHAHTPQAMRILISKHVSPYLIVVPTPTECEVCVLVWSSLRRRPLGVKSTHPAHHHRTSLSHRTTAVEVAHVRGGGLPPVWSMSLSNSSMSVDPRLSHFPHRTKSYWNQANNRYSNSDTDSSRRNRNKTSTPTLQHEAARRGSRSHSCGAD